MFSPHGQGRHHITSSGWKWTCLLWLVQRISNLLPLDTPINPPPPDSNNSCDWPFRQCHRQLVWDRVSLTHPESGNLPREDCWEYRGVTLWDLKGQRHQLVYRAMSPADVTGICLFCYSLSQGKKKTKNAMVIWNQREFPSLFFFTFTYSWLWDHPPKTTESWRLMTLSLTLFAETHLYAQLQFMSNERCRN